MYTLNRQRINIMPKGDKKTTQTATANTTPIAPSINSEAAGALSVPGRDNDRGSNTGKGDKPDDIASQRRAIVDKAIALSTTLNAKAQGRAEAAEEWLLKLIDGDINVRRRRRKLLTLQTLLMRQNTRK
jgi:hypothetical protein